MCINKFYEKIVSWFKTSWKRDLEKFKGNRKAFIVYLIKTFVISVVLIFIYIYLLFTSLVSLLYFNTSIFPVLFWVLIVAIGIYVYFSKHHRKEFPKYLAITLGAVLTLQSVYPVLAPKASFDDFEPIIGIIENSNNMRKDFIVSSVDVVIEPALFPNVFLLFYSIGNRVELPFAVTNLTDIDFYSINTPPLFSRITKLSDNSGQLFILADGWKYKELKTKIKFTGDIYTKLNADISYQPNYTATIKIENYKYYWSPISFRNNENFQTCFRNYEIVFQNNTEVFKTLSNKVFDLSLCDKPVNSTRCLGINPSGLFKLTNLKEIKTEIYNFCLESNKTLDYFLIFRPN